MRLTLLVAIAVLFASYAMAGQTCQTQCYYRGGVKTCNHYCWP